MTWDQLHDFLLLVAGFSVAFWFATGYPPVPPLIRRLRFTMGAAACVAAFYLLVLLLEASFPTLCLTTACNKTVEEAPAIVADKAPPVVPKPVRTFTITVGGRCPEGYQKVTRHDNGQTACARDFVPITK